MKNGRNGRNGLALALLVAALATGCGVGTWGTGRRGLNNPLEPVRQWTVRELTDGDFTESCYTVDLGTDAGWVLVVAATTTPLQVTLPDGTAADIGKRVSVVNARTGTVQVQATALESGTVFRTAVNKTSATFLMVGTNAWVFESRGVTGWNAGAVF
jgi:hypothetical protein